jgi:hypothetical protein
MTKASDNPFPSILFDESDPPSAPATGYKRLWLNGSNVNIIGSNSTIRTLAWSDTAGGLVNEDKGALQIGLGRPAASQTEDDQFDAGTLDGKWAAYSGADATINTTTIPGWASFTVAGAKLQAVPVGDWIAEVEVIIATTTAAGYSDCGIILTNGTTVGSATDCRYGVGMDNAVDAYRIVASKWINNAFSTVYFDWTATDANEPGFTDHLFIRVRKSGTTYDFDISSTGRSWQEIGTTGALGFTPTHFGIYSGSAGGHINYFVRYATAPTINEVS